MLSWIETLEDAWMGRICFADKDGCKLFGSQRAVDYSQLNGGTPKRYVRVLLSTPVNVTLFE